MHVGSRMIASVFAVRGQRSRSQYDQGPSEQWHTELDVISSCCLLKLSSALIIIVNGTICVTAVSGAESYSLQSASSEVSPAVQQDVDHSCKSSESKKKHKKKHHKRVRKAGMNCGDVCLCFVFCMFVLEHLCSYLCSRRI